MRLWRVRYSSVTTGPGFEAGWGPCLRHLLATSLLPLVLVLAAACGGLRQATHQNSHQTSHQTGGDGPTFVESAVSGSEPVYSYEIINTFDHDSGAFTQGLEFHDGNLYESTGEYGS